MRVVLGNKNRKDLFSRLKSLGVSDDALANTCKVSVRTISNWRSSKSTLPLGSYRILMAKARLEIDDSEILVVENWWNNSNAGKKGSLERTKRHGILGDGKSRQKGGQISYQRRKNDPADIFARKSARKAIKDVLLAEFVGIMIGDGGITEYQTVVTTNSEDDREHSQFVAQLAQKLFRIKPSLNDRNDSKCTRIVISSKELTNQLVELGLKRGHKLNQGLDVPDWVRKDEEFMKACLRGVFDTDGSIYQERHHRKGKTYCYSRLSFVSMSPQLRETMYESLRKFGFDPKIRGNRSVNLEQQKDIDMFFQIIGSNNPKHLRRYKQFGEVG